MIVFVTNLIVSKGSKLIDELFLKVGYLCKLQWVTYNKHQEPSLFITTLILFRDEVEPEIYKTCDKGGLGTGQIRDSLIVK
jgi:hypothetical protein